VTKYPVITPVRDADFGYGILPWAKGNEWRLEEPWKFHIGWGGKRWEYIVPEGYLFDGQSVPGFLHGFPFYFGPAGVGMRAGLIHDFSYDCYSGGSEWLRQKLGEIPEMPPIEAIDLAYYLTQLDDRQRPTKAFVTWRAVRAFGPYGFLRPRTIWRKLFK